MKNIALVVVSVLFTVLLVEVGLRVFGRYRPPDAPRPGFRDMYVADDAIGYHLWPSSRTCQRYPRTSKHFIEIISNSDGFRSSRELGEPDARPRILLAGDSNTMGLGVEEGQRMSEIVETLEPGWRVDNIGISGFGTDLMWRAVEAFHEKAQADAAVLAIYSDDFTRLAPHYSGIGRPLKRFGVEDGELVERPYLIFSGLRRSRIYYAYFKATHPRHRSYYELNEAVLDRFADRMQEAGIGRGVIFIPPPEDNQRAREQRAFLEEWSSRREVPYLDLAVPIFESDPAESFLPRNDHLNVRGHRVGGEAMLAWLREWFDAPPVRGAEAPTWPAPSGYCRDFSERAPDDFG